MPDPLARSAGRLLPWLLAAVSLIVGVAVIRPFVDVPVGFDTQASVAYFDRLVAGRTLEQALSTTPKPLITLTHGLLHIGTDWRPIVWATLLVHAAAAGLAGVLGARAAGLGPGIAAGLAVAGTPLLIEDTAFGNAVPGALLGWVGAGVLLSGDRPRPGLAGIALLLAALCRLETLVIVAVLGVAIGWARFGPWILPGARPSVPGRLWLAVAVPFGAVPVMLLHDWLLTGDPMYWLSVSQRYSDARRDSLDILDPLERIAWFVRRYRALWPLVLLGLVGLAVLVRGRRWGELVGLLAMGPGIAAFVVLLAVRGLYAPHRYAIPVDVAVFLGAAVGFGWLATATVRRLTSHALARVGLGAASFAVMVGALAVARAGPFDPETHRVVTEVRALNENAARVLPILERAAPGPGASVVRWHVPSAVRPRMAIDLDVPLTELGGLSLSAIDPATTTLVPGQVVYHDRRGNIPVGQYGRIESATEVVIGRIVLRPLVADDANGVWIHEVVGAR